MKNILLKIIRLFISFEKRVKIFWLGKKLKLTFSSSYNTTRNPEDLELAEEFVAFLNTKDEIELRTIINDLKNDLDEDSKEEIDKFIARKKYIFRHNLIEQKDLFTKKELAEQKDCSKESVKTRKRIRKFNIQKYNPESFYAISSLRWLPDNIKDKLKNGIFVDLGAYDGDSAISLINYFDAKKVFSFEPENTNFSILKDNAEIEKRIIPIKLGLSNRKGFSFISQLGSGSRMNNKVGEEINIDTLDNFIKENSIDKIDLIKMDIEGEELKALEGSLETIKKNIPVLAISIYHSANDFFFIKKWLEEKDLGYKYFIKKAHPFSLCSETMLIAYNEK